MTPITIAQGSDSERHQVHSVRSGRELMISRYEEKRSMFSRARAPMGAVAPGCPRDWALAIAGGLLGALLCGCGPDQQLGQNITGGNSEHPRNLVWAADGEEVFFISGNASFVGASSIKAARFDGSGVRVVDDAQDTYGQLWGSRDGSALFFNSFTPDGGTDEVFDVFQARKIAELGVGAGTFIASPNGRRLAFTAGRDVSVFDLDGGATLSLDPGDWRSITFSPSGEQLFLVSPTEGRTIDFSGNPIQTTPLALELNWASASWIDDAGIRIASGVNIVPSNYRIQSLTTGVDLRPSISYEIEGVAWATDASRIALWGNSCSAYSGFSCTSYGSSLYVVDTTSGDTRRIAFGDGLPGDAAFSPDGTRVAYVLSQNIYVIGAP